MFKGGTRGKEEDRSAEAAEGAEKRGEEEEKV